MGNKSKKTVLFSCKPCLTAMMPFVLAGSAFIVLCAVLGVWQVGASVCGIVLICKFTAVNSNGVTVTNIYVKSGKRTVPLGEITSVDCEQSFVGKLFGYGTVVICTSNKKLFIRGIPQTEALRNEISKQVDLYHFNCTCRQAEQARELMEKEL